MNSTYEDVMRRIDGAARSAGHRVSLVAVSKTKPVAAIRELAARGQRAFGENYVQEAMAKQCELADLGLEWHLIGPLQSNKCRDAARHFDWLQSLDRAKLITRLDHERPASRKPLNVLIQVNIDDESSKSGCAPEEMAGLAQQVAAATRLRLRGLMAIPAPRPELSARREAFDRMFTLFDRLRRDHQGVDTLSMGMSADFETAIAAGATMVRIGTALFGPRR